MTPDLFTPLPKEIRRSLEHLVKLIDKVFPLPGRFLTSLPGNIAELSRLLTYGRGDRTASYLGKPPLLSAYLRYFLPWNVYRLCCLFASMPLKLSPGDTVNDLGSGPLTFAISLWISRPDLRNVQLEFRCIDRTGAVLHAGKKLFAALAEANGGLCAWTIKTIVGEVRRNGKLSTEIRGQPASLCAAVNLYNEIFWELSPRDSHKLKQFAESQAELLSSMTAANGAVLVLEPGIPRSGEFVSLLRSFLIERGRPPLFPCTHFRACPMSGAQGEKWCHFAFDTGGAPGALHKLSAAARLPKERAVLSFVVSGSFQDLTNSASSFASEIPKELPPRTAPFKARIISDSFPLDSCTRCGKKETPAFAPRFGRYACSEHGLVLVSGERSGLETAASGTVRELLPCKAARDEKSGALMAVLLSKS